MRSRTVIAINFNWNVINSHCARIQYVGNFIKSRIWLNPLACKRSEIQLRNKVFLVFGFLRLCILFHCCSGSLIFLNIRHAMQVTGCVMCARVRWESKLYDNIKCNNKFSQQPKCISFNVLSRLKLTRADSRSLLRLLLKWIARDPIKNWNLLDLVLQQNNSY